MHRNFRKAPEPEPTAASPPSEAWLFAQVLLGKRIPSPYRAEAEARANREQLEFLAAISSEHKHLLRSQQQAEADARREREQLEWLAGISPRHERQLRDLQRAEAETAEAYERWKQYYEDSNAQEAWDPSKHPRQGGPPNAGWWASTGGAGGSGGRPGSLRQRQSCRRRWPSRCHASHARIGTCMVADKAIAAASSSRY